MWHVDINEWALTMQFSELYIICVQTFDVILFFHNHCFVNALMTPEGSLSASAVSLFFIVLCYCFDSIKNKSVHRALLGAIQVSQASLISSSTPTIGYICDQYRPQVLAQLLPPQSVCALLWSINFSIVRCFFFTPLTLQEFPTFWGKTQSGISDNITS